ncbi:MAG: DUF4258 domain-containing protein [Candidatus Aenigmarchaeota archaeon]|nr:DUF4258 domain-containing protein [Candidatus Aenigmarchaeota archaeon]
MPEAKISGHAREAMLRHAISEDEVLAALVDGETEFEIIHKKEKRYGNVLIQKHRKLIVIWTYRNGKKRIITCYPLRREI